MNQVAVRNRQGEGVDIFWGLNFMYLEGHILIKKICAAGVWHKTKIKVRTGAVNFMIIRSEELPIEQRTGERNGTLIRLLMPEQMHGRSRLFARILLKPGARAPYHQHNGDCEAYYILSGEGQANDNGVISQVKAGDIIFTDSGESHSIENTSEKDLEYIALITLV